MGVDVVELLARRGAVEAVVVAVGALIKDDAGPVMGDEIEGVSQLGATVACKRTEDITR